MAFSAVYRRQVALLVRSIPFAAEEKIFALKGGTAINLFLRAMPRLSIDIDLVYLPVEERGVSLAAIEAAMLRIQSRIENAIPGARIDAARRGEEDFVTRLVIRAQGVQIKIEVTPVLRGVVFDAMIRRVAPIVESAFGFAEMQVVSFPDLFAGKIVAALDRQHPRDLFDVRDLLANEGVDEALRCAFLIYLVSHNRPMHELLEPARKPLAEEFKRGFVGMTDAPVSLAELEAAREALIAEIVGGMPDGHRQFLIGFNKGEPDWALPGIANAENLPAVRWRQFNLEKLPEKRRRALTDALAHVLARNRVRRSVTQ